METEGLPFFPGTTVWLCPDGYIQASKKPRLPWPLPGPPETLPRARGSRGHQVGGRPGLLVRRISQGGAAVASIETGGVQLRVVIILLSWWTVVLCDGRGTALLPWKNLGQLWATSFVRTLWAQSLILASCLLSGKWRLTHSDSTGGVVGEMR